MVTGETWKRTWHEQVHIGDRVEEAFTAVNHGLLATEQILFRPLEESP